MNLSKYLQSPEILHEVGSKKPEEFRSYILDKGYQWFTHNPHETEVIKRNLDRFRISYTDERLNEIKEHIVLHYYEKLLGLCLHPTEFYSFLTTNIKGRTEAKKIKRSISAGNGILIVIAHFGGVELITPFLSSLKLPLNTVLRFTTEQFSNTVRQYTEKMQETGLFSSINLIEIGKPGTITALDMAAVLRNNNILISVFDEKTDYSIPVELFKRKIWGGAGLTKLLRFANTKVAVYNAFIIRTGTFSYQFKLIQAQAIQKKLVYNMYANLEGIISDHLEQWYFLHEEIPFIE